MKTRSAKSKGRRLQNQIKELLLESFKELEPDDVRSAIMGETGEDIKLSPAARRQIPYSFECKNQENLKLVEPLKFLFKDEVRKLGLELKLSKEIILRHPFPGPGLAIRIPGTINQEKINIWESLNQAEENSGDYPPVLIFKRNRSKTYAVLELEDFIDLIK